MLTDGLGRKQQIIFRYPRTEQAAAAAQEPRKVDRAARVRPKTPAMSTTRPLLLSAVDERTKAPAACIAWRSPARPSRQSS